jgi:hypothetical protein
MDHPSRPSGRMPSTKRNRAFLTRGKQAQAHVIRTVLAEYLWQVPQLDQLIEFDPDHEIFPKL